MKTPRKAILLAAGFGTRMRPLSDDLPKALMPLWGRPLLDHMIGMMIRWGVREVLVNLHHRSDEMIRHLRSCAGGGVRINMSFEPEILGTGGALMRAGWFIGSDPFWVANTDIAADVPSAPFKAAFDRMRPLAALWLDPARGPRTVEVAGGKIVSFRAGAGVSCGERFTFCGIQLVSTEILRFLPDRGFATLVGAYEKGMAAGMTVAGIAVPGSFWSDLGTPAAYLEAHGEILRARRAGGAGANLLGADGLRGMRELRKRGVRVDGFASIGAGAGAAPGARLRDVVLWDGARVGAAGRLAGAIASRGAVVDGPARGVVVRADLLGVGPGVGRAADLMGWRMERCSAHPLPERGSDRSFAVLMNGRRRAVLMRYGTVRAENGRYAGHARFLRRMGIPAPRILADLPGDRIVVLEYLGETSLETMAPSLSRDDLIAVYRRVLDIVLRFHSCTSALVRKHGIELEPPFCPKVFRWERGLMARHFLAAAPAVRPSDARAVMGELEGVAGRLMRLPRVLVHRDLQSSNVLWHENRPRLIDFQGMRLGPAVYDVASLLCDPYVMLDEDAQNMLLDYYAARSPDPREIKSAFWHGAVERLSQALGAFGRLAAQPPTARFKAYIDPAMVMMQRALSHMDGMDRLKSVIAGRLPGGRSA